MEGLGVSSPYKFEEICNFEKLLRYFVISRNFMGIFVNFPYIYREPKLSNSIPQFIKDAPPKAKAAQIWNIMHHVVSGISFIHSRQEVHRDIKPRNGFSPFPDKLNVSSLFAQR